MLTHTHTHELTGLNTRESKRKAVSWLVDLVHIIKPGAYDSLSSSATCTVFMTLSGDDYVKLTSVLSQYRQWSAAIVRHPRLHSLGRMVVIGDGCGQTVEIGPFA